MKYIDTHSHYDHFKFNTNRERIFSEISNDVNYVINLGTNIATNKKTINLINKYDFIYGMLGFFPNETYLLEPSICKDAKKNLDEYLKSLEREKVIGVGEIGLDYYWDTVGPKDCQIKGENAREIQKKWFKKQLDISIDRNLPVSIHCRNAEKDMISILKEYRSISGVVHCFSHGTKEAEFFINKGLYLGVGGTSTYPSNLELREVIRECPIEKILLETDAPYLSPQQVRGSINNSSHIKYVIENISNIKEISVEEVIKQTNKNAMKLFKFK